MRNENLFRLNLLASAVRGAFRRPLDLALLAVAAPSLVFAGPDGGSVVAGSATISNPTLDGTQIHQTSQQAILNWQNFSIGSSEYVQFQQPNSSAVALNRVVGGNPSSILGSLSANGQVFLVNPHGVFFGQGASVDVAGLVATTMAISDSNFLSGNYVFTAPAGGPAGQVVNQGVINANGGYVVLAGDYTANSGVIQARLGTVVLASGAGMTMDLAGDGLINLAVDEKTVSSLAGVENSGQIIANGGTVIMTAKVADGLIGAAVNNSGQIQAQGVVEQGGEIYLVADGGDVVNSGLLDASGATDGGAVKLVSSHDVAVAAGAQIKADGGAAGTGGEVRLIAKNFLDFQDGASVSATGGESGGLVEVSGHGGIRVAGDVSLGAGGKYFIDPPVVTVTGGANLGAVNTLYEEDIESDLNDGTDVFIVAAVAAGASAGASASVLFKEADGGEGFANFTAGLNAASGGGGLFIGVGRDASDGTLFGAVTQTRNAVGNIDLAGVPINILGDLQLIAGVVTGDILGVSALAANNVTLEAGEAGGAIRDQSGVVSIDAAGAVHIDADVIVGGTSYANLSVIARGDALDSSGLTINGDVTVTASNGYGGAEARALLQTGFDSCDGACSYHGGGDLVVNGRVEVLATGQDRAGAMLSFTAFENDLGGGIDGGGSVIINGLGVTVRAEETLGGAVGSADAHFQIEALGGRIAINAPILASAAAAEGPSYADIEMTGGLLPDAALGVVEIAINSVVEAKISSPNVLALRGGTILIEGGGEIETSGAGLLRADGVFFNPSYTSSSGAGPFSGGSAGAVFAVAVEAPLLGIGNNLASITIVDGVEGAVTVGFGASYDAQASSGSPSIKFSGGSGTGDVTLTTLGDLAIIAGSGSKDVNVASLTLNVAGTIGKSSLGEVPTNTLAIQTGGDLTVNSGTFNITGSSFASLSISAGGDVTAGDIAVSAFAPDDSGSADVSVSAVGDIAIGNVTVLASGLTSASASLIVLAGGDVTAGDIAVSAFAPDDSGSADVSVSAVGDIAIGNVTVLASASDGSVDLSFNAGGDVTAGDIAVSAISLGSYASASVDVVAGGNVIVGNMTAVATALNSDAVASLSIGAGSSISVESLTVTASGDTASGNASGILDLEGGDIVVTGPVSVFAQGGIASGDVVRAAATFDASSSLTLDGGIEVSALGGNSAGTVGAFVNLTAGTELLVNGATASFAGVVGNAAINLLNQSSYGVVVGGDLTVNWSGSGGEAGVHIDAYGGTVQVDGAVNITLDSTAGGYGGPIDGHYLVGAESSLDQVNQNGAVNVTVNAADGEARVELYVARGDLVVANAVTVSENGNAVSIDTAQFIASASGDIQLAAVTVTELGEVAHALIDVDARGNIFANGDLTAIAGAEEEGNNSSALAEVYLTAGFDGGEGNLTLTGDLTASAINTSSDGSAEANVELSANRNSGYGGSIFQNGDVTVTAVGSEAFFSAFAYGGDLVANGDTTVSAEGLGYGGFAEAGYQAGAFGSFGYGGSITQDGDVTVSAVDTYGGNASFDAQAYGGDFSAGGDTIVEAEALAYGGGSSANYSVSAFGDGGGYGGNITQDGDVAVTAVGSEAFFSAFAYGGDFVANGDTTVSAAGLGDEEVFAEAGYRVGAFSDGGYGGAITQNGDVTVTAVDSEAGAFFSANAYGGDFVANGDTTVSAAGLGYGGFAGAGYQAGAFGSDGYGGNIQVNGNVTASAVNTYGGAESFVAFIADQAIQGNGLVSADELDLNVDGGGLATVDLRTKARNIEVRNVDDLAIDNFAEKDPVFLSIFGGLAGGIDFETGGDLDAGIEVEAGGDVFIGAAGDFEASEAQIFTNGTIDLVAGGDLDVSNANLSASYDEGLFLAAGGDVYSGYGGYGGGAQIFGGMVGVFAGGDVLLGDSTVNVGDHADPSRHSGDPAIVAFLNANLPFVDAETEEEFNFPPQSSTPNAFFIAQGNGEAEGVVDLNQINMDGDYLWLQGNDIQLGGWSGPSTILAQILPSNAAAFNVEQSAGELEGVVYSYDDLFSQFGETTFALGASFLPFNVSIGADGTIEFGDANVIIGTNGSVTGLGNIITDGLVAVVGLRVLAANEIGAAGDLLDEEYGDDEDDDEEEAGEEGDTEEGGGGGLVEEEEAGEDNLECT